ncbi:MAG: hypothetical protein ACI977_000818 [Candidatus Nanohaloarchaea archaeon]|jgi:uncharacterized protein (TIRG00374 family)
MKGKRLKWALVATVFLGILIYLADVREFLHFIGSSNKTYLLGALLCGLTAVPFLANSWHQFINRVGGKQSFPSSLRLFMAGNFMNAVTPLGQFGGEPFMAYIIKDNTDISYQQALSSVISADIINTIPVLTFTLIGTIYMFASSSLNNFLLELLFVVFIFSVVGGTLIFLLWFKPGFIEQRVLVSVDKITRIIGRGEHYIESLEERLKEIEDSFETLGSSKSFLAKTALVAHIFFILQVTCFYLITRGLGLEVPVVLIIFALPLASLATFAPTPGGSGAYEATMTSILITLAGISYTPALAAAVLFRAVTYWQDIVLGYLSFITLPKTSKDEIDEETISELE